MWAWLVGLLGWLSDKDERRDVPEGVEECEFVD